MSVSEKQSRTPIGTAEAFYVIFKALPKKERITVAQYILADDDIRHCCDLSGIPNETTLKAFVEDKSAMPLFHSVEELQKDLLVPDQINSDGLFQIQDVGATPRGCPFHGNRGSHGGCPYIIPARHNLFGQVLG